MFHVKVERRGPLLTYGVKSAVVMQGAVESCHRSRCTISFAEVPQHTREEKLDQSRTLILDSGMDGSQV